MRGDFTEIGFRPYAPTDRTWVRETNLRHYREVEGFDAGFAEALDGALALIEGQCTGADVEFIIAEVGGQPLATLFLCRESDEAARIRLFYIDPEWRGCGLGHRMLDRAIAAAKAHGYRRLCVSTFSRHGAACHLYHLRGFRGAVHPPAEVFGQTLVQVDYSLSLTPGD
ncbi:GNAT family N-acetyltransferase [Roseovarius sp. C7]|uniref:GNAT family N-acetyltransferase n=1 Tax=Roseovarius sp. C7 TaxID=3398643 RepID=UPI0039F741A5